jgi:N,N'-diacetyllegionaminate synthase
MKQELNIKIGYSDHTLGIEVSIVAAAMGAEVIEKHFTLDRSMEGPDHSASLEPDKLEKMVISIRNIEKAMGNGIKRPSESEIKNISAVRKSIVANCKINKGEEFTEKNLTVKRPGTGITPIKWDKIMGLKAKRTFEKDELIEL